MLARVALREGRLRQVEDLAGAGRSAARHAGQQRLERMPLHLQAVAARLQGDLATARRFYQESITLNRSLGEERMVAAEFHNLGYVELHDGHPEVAREQFTRARTEARRLDYTALFPHLIADAAVIAAEIGDLKQAARLFGASRAAGIAAGQVPDPDDAAEQERLRDQLITGLGEEEFRAISEAGARLTVEEALSEASRS
ncbi:MAG: hypothetical protein NVS3B18_15230 [Candidatus Dormibacteria bacterium]